ncbi:efflux RND transporter periplasmic adaptor subunit [Arvimicrobium flavum]|uniref:efflux RND transporter periplasmic adaptor subunit n=1 Tax=Arvimicrobium flavum TaxID=3393320 RepID=UPI00237B317F|nr:efflux RND transporter periplasmic adaptor subunit [Mesorhizobium shangrilense]
MKVWKQILLCVAILLVAAGVWVRFFPGAQETLAGWGFEWALAATPAADGKPAGNQPPRAAPTLPVITDQVTMETINDRLRAIGTGRANATVTVTPYTSGRLTEFVVQSGAHVNSGQVIARLDSETEEIALERAKVARDQADAKVTRFRALRSSNATTVVQLTDAETELRNAELSVHEAQVALDRRSVVAPISGIVGILPIEAGNNVTSQSAIATIDDRSSILVDFWVPERFAAAVRIGAELSATPLANPKESFRGTISAIDNRIDDKSRTLWVQARIANPADSLRAGMSFEITMRFPGDTYPAVSPLAIQWGADGAYIWAVDAGKAKRVPVRIIQRNTESVLIEAGVASGDMVVTEGVQNIREGDEVRIARNEQPPAPGGS